MPHTSLRYWASLCYLAWMVGAASAQPGAYTVPRQLFDRNTLIGWDHGDQQPQGWSILDGRLSGNSRSTPLLSGWTLGDFELTGRFLAVNAGAWQVEFPQVPDGPGVGIALDQPGEHRFRISRRGPTLQLQVDDKLVSTRNVPGENRYGLSVAITAGEGSLWDLQLAEPLGKPLFNGVDLTGWWTPGNLASWVVEQGELVLVNKNGNYLRTEQEYGNFTLSLEYKIRKRGNSGIGIRTARNGWPSGDGMELQIEEGRGRDASATMAIYRNLEPIALAEKSDDWNQVVIKADGRMISAWLNGVLVQQVNTARLSELRHRPLQGWIGFQDHGAPTRFRNLNILEAPSGLGLAAWYKPRLESGSQFVLDRLMNPDRLALREPISAASISKQCDGPGEHLLAELTGPGALVRIASTNESGKLAFYFDGEARPRIECPANQLHKFVPPVGEEARPVLTYLGYAKRLKVVLREAKPVEYRLDHVKLPAGMPVDAFVNRNSSLARGLLPALDYKRFQISHGTYRDNDPLPRVASPKKRLEPGKAERLISQEGSGMVRWLRIDGDPKLLANQDLWLEVAVDGQPQPSIVAPARYLFPGLATGQNYHNFMVVNRNGPVSLLAMPYANGLTISAINRGAKPISGVGLTISYEPLSAAEVARLGRLHGVIQAGNLSSSGELARISGSGRLIGLVCEAGVKGRLEFEVDGNVNAAMGGEFETLLGIPASLPEQRRCLSGRFGGLEWCYLNLAPVEFNQSLAIRLQQGDASVGRLALYYAR